MVICYKYTVSKYLPNLCFTITFLGDLRLVSKGATAASTN